MFHLIGTDADLMFVKSKLVQYLSQQILEGTRKCKALALSVDSSAFTVLLRMSPRPLHYTTPGSVVVAQRGFNFSIPLKLAEFL